MNSLCPGTRQWLERASWSCKPLPGATAPGRKSADPEGFFDVEDRHRCRKIETRAAALPAMLEVSNRMRCEKLWEVNQEKSIFCNFLVLSCTLIIDLYRMWLMSWCFSDWRPWNSLLFFPNLSFEILFTVGLGRGSHSRGSHSEASYFDFKVLPG